MRAKVQPSGSVETAAKNQRNVPLRHHLSGDRREVKRFGLDGVARREVASPLLEEVGPIRSGRGASDCTGPLRTPGADLLGRLAALARGQGDQDRRADQPGQQRADGLEARGAARQPLLPRRRTPLHYQTRRILGLDNSMPLRTLDPKLVAEQLRNGVFS